MRDFAGDQQGNQRPADVSCASAQADLAFFS